MLNRIPDTLMSPASMPYSYGDWQNGHLKAWSKHSFGTQVACSCICAEWLEISLISVDARSTRRVKPIPLDVGSYTWYVPEPKL